MFGTQFVLTNSIFQELKMKLAEEISRMRYFITGQRSEEVSLCKTEETPSNLEVLKIKT